MQQKYKEVGKICLNGPSGKYLKYVGAAATVRDLVALADALDKPGEPINYVGISYGTLLGSWFVNSTSFLPLYSMLSLRVTVQCSLK